MQTGKIPRQIILTFGTTILLFFFQTGCGENNGKENCSEVPNSCDELSSLRCSENKSSIEVCQENEDGCLVWSLHLDCTLNGKVCDDSGEEPVCSCASTCATAGETRCEGTILQTCTEEENGCLNWRTTENCSDSGKICDDSGDEARCIEGCSDECDYVGQTDCRDTIIITCVMGGNSCLQWEEGTNCADSGKTCAVINYEAQCIESCTNECNTPNATRCNENIVEMCSEGENGCLEWKTEIDCQAESKICRTNPDTGQGECVTSCTSDCDTENDTQCNGTIIQTCSLTPDGCLVWTSGEDCATSGRFCDDTSEPALCVTGSGDSCENFEFIPSVPFVKSGDDFTADYHDDMSLTDSSCVTRSNRQVEAVFAIDLKAGEELVVWELGEMDAVLSLQNSCGSSSPCLVSDDFLLDDGPARYTATTDERIYIIIEAYSSSPIYTDYEIQIGISQPENCGDGIDNDIDLLTDCDDDDCFGNPAHCSTETNCEDNNDNDNDGNIDCTDSDCSANPICQPYRGYWEEFSSTNPVDVTGYSITFTPDISNENMYSYSVTGGITDFAITPGTGTITTTLSLSDDSYQEYRLTAAGSIRFFNITYTGLFIGSNGFITFGSGDSSRDLTEYGFFEFPKIGGFDADLDPQNGTGGTITVDEFSDKIAVTFDGVPKWFSSQTVSFQIVINSTNHTTASGEISVYYKEIQIPDTGIIGISSGVGNGTYPPQTNFIP